MKAFEEYLAELKKNLAHGDATEHTHRPALKVLLESVAKGVTATNEPKRVLCGAPDFNITKGKIPLGHVETKDIGESLATIEKAKPPHDEQFSRYRDGLPNWILTDYLEFRWYVKGEHRMTARLAQLDSKGTLKLISTGEEEVENLLQAFFTQKELTIGTAKELANRMAGMARIIRDLITKTFEHEIEKGFLHSWLAAFRETLIPDLDEKQFADMFAQTLAYGLFAARVHTPPSKPFSREMAAFDLPKTNPFLRKLFSEIAGVDMPETVAWAVDDIVELLNHTDLAAVLENFGKGKGKKDPVVHFYEDFLRAYDPALRVRRGVYYTPEAVVSYIVRSIDHLLKTRFNRTKGLADENTLILDPATGTATFLYFVITEIFQKFVKQRGAWDSYVGKHLLNRIFGFELLMAPYAIAHLKLGMQLEEFGYEFATQQRLGIYLTNTLEEAIKRSEKLFAQWISDEANEAAEIKKDKKIMVVLGNPPYSGISANRGEWITELIKSYRRVDNQPLGEKKVWLKNDYIKFLRFGEWRIERTGHGILAFITDHSYLDSPTFRGMRQHLLRTFDEVYILNLHGNAKRRESAPTGGKDENVFDITQGVAIALFVKSPTENLSRRICYADLWGSREVKYQTLFENEVSTTDWTEIKPSAPFFLLKPVPRRAAAEYEENWELKNIFLPGSGSNGIQTSRDSLVVAFDRRELEDRITAFADADKNDAEIRAEFFATKSTGQYLAGDTREWKLGDARAQLNKNKTWRKDICPYLYRPFDKRSVLYTDSMVDWPRFEVMQHLVRKNRALCIGRAGLVASGEWDLVFTASEICDHNLFYRGSSLNFPLYLYETENKKKGDRGKMITLALFESPASYRTRRPNLRLTFLKGLAEKLKLPLSKPHGLPKGITPEDIFHYAYAVFHSPTYRTRYAESLKIDFPRLPITSDLKLFRTLAEKGAELTASHVMESSKLNDFITEFPVKGNNEVKRVQYTDKDQRVWINSEQYFGGVPRGVWKFYIGGYQTCEKWLKDRKGRELSYDDIQHYQKIVVALSETIRLMNEVDAAIPEWPIR
jgi:predicted helicase